MSYSATGDRALSEDVAQETFVAAWNGLSELQEPAKLRSWLCSIARNLSSKALRRVGREIPSDEEVQAAVHKAQTVPSPLEHIVDKELEHLVWTTLHSVPEIYREPLVLFYREDQSAREVAFALGLSEDAVHQRLSRGRQHLKASVAQLVEGTLERTKPSKALCTGVVLAITAGAKGTAEAATPIPALAKGLLTMKMWKLGIAALVLILLALDGPFFLDVCTSGKTTANEANATMSAADHRLASLQKNRRIVPELLSDNCISPSTTTSPKFPGS